MNDVKNPNMTWDNKLEMFRRFININNALPTREEIYEGFRIGEWLHELKQSLKKKTLLDDKIQQLNEIYPNWNSNTKC